MSVADYFKRVWHDYRGTDIYDSDDFEALWETEEQEPKNLSPLLNPYKKEKKDKSTLYNTKKKETTNVIEHPSLTPQSEVRVLEPRSFDEALDIVEELRCRRSVVLNLQYLDAEQSQRVVDFLSGATHALDGHQQRVGQGVFIFAPSNFTINTESQEAKALKDAFWGKAKEKAKEIQTYQEYQYAEPLKKSSIF